MQKLLKIAEKAFEKPHATLSDFKVGDTICVNVRIQEKTKERIQKFEGVVLQITGHKNHIQNVTVRRVKNQIAVERIFPMPSAMIESVEVKQRGVFRQSRILYLRTKKGASAKIRPKIG